LRNQPWREQHRLVVFSQYPWLNSAIGYPPEVQVLLAADSLFHLGLFHLRGAIRFQLDGVGRKICSLFRPARNYWNTLDKPDNLNLGEQE